jgi:hypothetical protein
MKYLRILLFSAFLMSALPALPQAQGSAPAAEQVEMADDLRSSGKIYVVVLVVMTVFTGLMIYALLTDRKLREVEKELEDMQKRIGRKEP